MERRFGRVARVVALGAVLALFPVGAEAQPALCTEPSEADYDRDGWSDAQECAGIELMEGVTVLGPTGPTGFVPSCFASELPRAQCLHPAEPDLFVIVVRASPSYLPDDLLADTSRPRGEGGLGVATHEVMGADPTGDRRVSSASSQKAVQLTEDLDPDGNYLGVANYGTPNNLDRARIWTARIRRYVEQQCGSGVCQTDWGEPEEGVEAVSEALTRWVANHELGHMFRLTADFDKRFGGYHLPTTKKGLRKMMEQFPVVQTNRKTKAVTFFIPHTYDASSLANLRLSSP